MNVFKRCFYLLLFSSIGLPGLISAQTLETSRQIALKVFDEIQQNSLYKKSVGWDTIKPVFIAKLDTARSEDSQFRQFRWLFNKLHDFHSAVYYKNKPYQLFKPTPPGRDKEFKTLFDAVRTNNGKLKAQLLPGDIAYMLIPAANILGQSAIDSLSREWRKTICGALNNNIKGYIIDLRLNMGGNMYPMLAAVSHLMGDKKVAGTTSQGGQVNDWWEIKKGDVYLDTARLTFSGPHCLKSKPVIPLAVLTSYFTISSGEIMTVAFKKRPHTLQVGDTTGGLVTNNHYYKVADETYLNLSVGYFADREGSVYKTGISPDVYLRGDDDFTNTIDDKKVKAALDWLKSEIHKS